MSRIDTSEMAPLDYSFYNMTSLQETLDNEPRQLQTSHKTHAPAGKPGEKKLSRSKCFKLNNNGLSEVTELKIVAEQLYEDVDSVAWIDLSFNELTKIDDVILQFPNLQILYLHGNQISDLKEVEKLARLTNLKKLSLHGNPVDNEKGYKYMVLSMLPNLQVLDFSRVTKADKKTASTLSSMTKPPRKKKPKADD